jgi:hypothetical protein
MEHGAWGIEKGVRSQNPEFRRKAIKIDPLIATGTNYLFLVPSA